MGPLEGLQGEDLPRAGPKGKSRFKDISEPTWHEGQDFSCTLAVSGIPQGCMICPHLWPIDRWRPLQSNSVSLAYLLTIIFMHSSSIPYKSDCCNARVQQISIASLPSSCGGLASGQFGLIFQSFNTPQWFTTLKRLLSSLSHLPITCHISHSLELGSSLGNLNRCGKEEWGTHFYFQPIHQLLLRYFNYDELRAISHSTVLVNSKD